LDCRLPKDTERKGEVWVIDFRKILRGKDKVLIIDFRKILSGVDDTLLTGILRLFPLSFFSSFSVLSDSFKNGNMIISR
jgi:hypothetical protein